MCSTRFPVTKAGWSFIQSSAKHLNALSLCSPNHKVALGMQLPRDQLSAAGRARAAAAAIEGRFRSSIAEPTAMSVRNVGQRKKVGPERDPRDWLRILRGDSSAGKGGLSEDCYDRPRKHPRDRSSSGDKKRLNPVMRRPPFEAEMPSSWSCAPKRHQSDRSASAGRSRDRGKRGGGYYRTPILSGSRKAGGCSSWSPPRTRTRWTKNAADSSSPGSTANTEYGAEWGSCEYGSGDVEIASVESPNRRRTLSKRDRGGRSDGGRGRFLSPLMVPLDPYRSPLTVVRAGTLVSRKDAAGVERSSRHARRAVRWASEAQAAAETPLADAEMASCPAGRELWGPGETPHRGGGRRGRDAWVVGAEDGNRQEEVGIDRMKHLLPSVERMSRELRAIRRADAAMREEQLAQVIYNYHCSSPPFCYLPALYSPPPPIVRAHLKN